MNILSRSLSKYLKGIALILMVMEHAFGAPRYYIPGISYPSLFDYAKEIDNFAAFAVVPMFMFLTGWTYYHHEDKSFCYSVKKITVFLVDFWMILVVYAGIACHICGYPLTGVEFLQELFGISRNIMIFSWYVFLYIMIMIALPFWAKYTRNLSFKKTAIAFILFFAVIKGWLVVK